MSMARLLITAVRTERRSISEVARDYHVSRRWVHELRGRFDHEGEIAFEPRSRRPHRSPNAVCAEVEDQIIRLRKELTKKGVDAGAETIQAHLARRTPRSQTSSPAQLPAVSTIWRVLVRRGFVTPQPQKRPKSSWRRFEAEQPNEHWQTDLTHWQLANGTEVEILNIIDDHSRLAIGSTVRRNTLAADVVTAFVRAFRRHGIPARVLSDNAAVFTGYSRGPRPGRPRAHPAQTVVFDHSRPYHPQTCGKAERFHQTQKKWLAAQTPATTIRVLQAQVNSFNAYYNTVRPHRALNRQTPLQAYQARPKATPHGPIIPDHYRVRRDVIDTSGTITLRHDSRLHHIGLGRQLAGTHLLVLVDDLDVRVITRNGDLIRALTLNPARNHQPTGRPPGPPKQTRKRE